MANVNRFTGGVFSNCTGASVFVGTSPVVRELNRCQISAVMPFHTDIHLHVLLLTHCHCTYCIQQCGEQLPQPAYLPSTEFLGSPPHCPDGYSAADQQAVLLSAWVMDKVTTSLFIGAIKLSTQE